MAASSLTRVNQKVAYCRALLKLIRQEPAPANANERLRLQALLDGAAFHLVCACRHYLGEVAENHGVQAISGLLTEQDLLLALERLGKAPAEARELKALREDPQSWLGQLYAAYNACWQPPGDADSVGRIQVVDLDAPGGSSNAVSHDSLMHWFQSFNELVERQRETSAEY